MGGGAGYPDYVSEQRVLTQRGRRYAKLMRTFATPGTLFDVGAAAGFIADGFGSEGWKPAGLEPNRSMAEFASAELGLEVHNCSLEEFEITKRYDLVSAIQVMGHFVDPHAAASQLARLTRQQGFCLIESWDRNSLSARLFGSRWHEYSPPSVLHYFNREGLTRLMTDHGFRLVRSGLMPKWIDGAHAKSLLRHKLSEMPGGSALARMTDWLPGRISVPYPGDDLKWWLFQREAESL
jgi:SAM-dependent methyltransferase